MAAFFRRTPPRFFAHRGASGEAPENTLTAFARAVTLDLEYAELDVQATRDGVVVVLHDSAVDRTTDGRGNVCDFTFAELRRLDAGYRFSSDGGQTFPFRATGVTIPTLSEILEALPSLHLTIEIKQSDPPIEELVIAAVRRGRREEQVILASEHDQVLQRVRTQAPDLATSFAFGEVTEFLQRVMGDQLDGYQPPGLALQIPPEFQGMPLVTEATVAAAHALGCEMHVWTINEPEEMQRLLDLGVDGVMSDFPARLLDVARRRQS
ncbi:MAG: glycerophosphodiester phosphodiesterase [Candidatus Binatia bacterium]